MKLSIVIRCLDRLEYTIRTIESIDRLSGLDKKDYEIICIDQASKDGTRDWLLSVRNDGYYPIIPEINKENIGDGPGMQQGIGLASGEFIAQHDNDLLIESPKYFERLIRLYEMLESKNYKPCAVGASHYQGNNLDTAPRKFAKQRFPAMDSILFHTYIEKNKEDVERYEENLIPMSWISGSFIFRRKFVTKKFGKGMCNSWCGSWWDEGYNNFLCSTIKFWHIDSEYGKGGEYVKKQAEKFPNYKYIEKHYRSFIK